MWIRANNVGAYACYIDSNEIGKTMREHNENTCNVREMVGTRLHRVRHSWTVGLGVINQCALRPAKPHCTSTHV